MMHGQRNMKLFRNVCIRLPTDAVSHFTRTGSISLLVVTCRG